MIFAFEPQRRKNVRGARKLLEFAVQRKTNLCENERIPRFEVRIFLIPAVLPPSMGLI